MGLVRLELQDLRVLRDVALVPAASLNFLVGPNGSGKSTVLEGISLLGLGRSFRTRRSHEAISWGAERLCVSGVVQLEEGRMVTVGIEKRGAGGRIRLGGRDVETASELARVMPILVITPESEGILTGGAEQRRRLIDWALFHVEPGYLPVHQAYQRALRQRNALLKAPGFGEEREVWDRQLVQSGEAIHRYRTGYLRELLPLVGEVAADLQTPEVNLVYRPGWDLGAGLDRDLARSAEGDVRRGWTGAGPHRADLVLLAQDVAARKILSRGEGRLWVATLLLAHLRYVARRTGRVPVVLVDDFGAELDAPSRGRFLGALGKLGGQMFVTAVSAEGFEHEAWKDKKMFHVEQGHLTEVV